MRRTSKYKKWPIGVVAGILLVPTTLFVAFKANVEARAAARARELIAEARTISSDEERLATLLTIRIHADFSGPDHWRRGRFIPKLRPLITHRFFPRALRIREGAVEILYPHGQCDSAARALVFALAVAGFEAAQLNMVTPSAAHSAVIAMLRGKEPVLLDPYYGTVARSAGRLIGPDRAQALMRQGAQFDEILPSLSPSSNVEFYRSFAKASFARQGEPMLLAAEVSLPQGEAIQLGTLDGSSSDVQSDSVKAGLTPHWTYMGHKYDRSWVRSLTVQQATRVVFGLVQKPEGKFITSNRQPVIVGNELIFRLSRGSALRFVDGRAGYNLLTLKSYLDVDYIRFERLPAPQSEQ